MFPKTKIAAVLAVSFGVMASAQANTISLELNASSHSQAGTQVASNTDTGTTSVNAPSSVSALNSFAFANGNAKGNDSGWFYTTASASGLASNTSQVSQNYEVTNTGGDQFFDFDFNVMNGSIDIYCNDGYGDGYGDFNVNSDGFPIALALVADPVELSTCASSLNAASTYDASISLNGAVIWNSFASLTLDNNAVTFAEGGTQSLGTYNGNSYFGWNAQMFNIDLGVIGAGETFNLQYTVTATATNTSDDPFAVDTGSNFLDSYAQFGDPNGFNSYSANSFASATTNPVSAPGTVALFGLALFGAAGFARKK